MLSRAVMVLIGAVAMPALAQTAAVTAKAAPKPIKKICRTYEETGSIMGGKKICHTKAEWESIDTNNGTAAASATDNRRSGGGGGAPF